MEFTITGIALGLLILTIVSISGIRTNKTNIKRIIRKEQKMSKEINAIFEKEKEVD